MISPLLITAFTALCLPSTSALPARSEPRSLVKKASSGIPYSPHTFSFAASVPRPPTLQAAFSEKVAAVGGSTTVSLEAPGGAVSYAVNITIANQTFLVIADTGSSDLWLHTSNFTCLDSNSTVIPQAECNFGPIGFNQTADNYHLLNYTNNFNISYGDGTFVSGYAGTDTVTIGNLSVPNTTFAVAEEAYWQGDGITDGLLGLAAPLLTSVYYGSNGAVDSNNNSALYKPWFYQAVSEGLVEPYFSLVINRPTLPEEENYNATVPNLGSLTFGGIPTNIPLTNTTVTVPNLNFTATIDGTNQTSPAYYTTSASSFTFTGSNTFNTSAPTIILDSGTTLVYLPDEVAEAYNTLWEPAALYDQEEQVYYVECNATAPSLGVVIGGVEFTFDPRDLVYSAQDGFDSDCISSINPSGSVSGGGVSILGDRFLTNVVSTFNIATGEITITQRQSY